jgi:glycosyltransferase involved in cell wall biosynthesis
MIDVIIPARNEAATIENVVSTFLQVPEIGHVIVVTNGCHDRTGEIAHAAGACHMHSPVIGKGQAIAVGLQHVGTRRIILCDGDLTGLTVRHVEYFALGFPSPKRMYIGVPDFTQNTPWAKPGDLFSRLSGIRALPTTVLRELAAADLLFGYTVEVILNRYAAINRMPVDRILLPGVKGTPRYGRERKWQMIADREWLIGKGLW